MSDQHKKEQETTFPNSVKIGQSDKEPMADSENLEESGMIMGPEHPIFQQGPSEEPSAATTKVPPGACFDPISPVGAPSALHPPRGPIDLRTQEPDQDELLPPGMSPSQFRKKKSPNFSLPKPPSGGGGGWKPRFL